ncbi:putative peptide zinc metalloprotease protein YydH [Botrimarina colliarenosi]|uniref:Putative peptide zinc metalloprotease protein YydH n=1 Tax=Botrimarina colliarenosi TaxID=2528001 RepID=A0A5C6A631_9BACT|nr:HlyD family efflux transporter periplasmic adaptor subunit [Botrimarina colliarenosi]TWT94840.1 putative peptide zinc metalloprotease protein YydH [Botrimarina colliarenosi]
MASLADSLVSSSSRRLPIRVRPDLEAKKQRYQGRVYWVVKDPVALQYFRFEEEEFAILEMLDGDSSLDEIAEEFERRFPPQSIRTEELQQFVGTLHRSGLVITDAPGQGDQLKKRRDERVGKELQQKFTNILSVRFKGIDPDWILNLLYSFPPVRWFFSQTAFVLCMMLCLSALLLIGVQFDVFQSKLPAFNTFFAAENWMLLAVVLACTKILHEFGHGLSCKHFGGECHEMGVMLLVLTPCLYCNVSDSWMLPNKWHRAAIGAAGMYVEVVLASICTYIWWFTEPGLLHYVCLNIMFVSSVSTILFNANPLLRYDGYYIVSDLLEVPNLRQKSSSILTRKAAEWCLGMEQQDDPFLPQRNQFLFATYTVAAAIYRWVVVLSILYFLNQVFEPYGLKPLGQAIGAMALWGLVGQPFVKLFKFFKVPGRLNKVKRVPLLITLLVIAGVIAAVATVPLPAYVYCPAVVHPRGAVSVYAEVPATLEAVLVKPGDRVVVGQELGRMKSLDLEVEIARLEGEVAGYEAEIRSLETVAFSDETASSRLAQVRESLAGAKEQLKKQLEDAERLVLRAPVAGVVMEPDYRTNRGQDPKDLAVWEGTPLKPENRGATLESGDRFCRIGDQRSLEARIVIGQDDIDLVLEGQAVRLMLNQTTDLKYVSKITKISSEELPETPPRLSSLTGGSVATETDPSGAAKPLSPMYEAIIPLGDYDRLPEAAQQQHDLLRVGLVGEAKITIEPRTLWQRFWRYLTRTVNFDL